MAWELTWCREVPARTAWGAAQGQHEEQAHSALITLQHCLSVLAQHMQSLGYARERMTLRTRVRCPDETPKHPARIITAVRPSGLRNHSKAEESQYALMDWWEMANSSCVQGMRCGVCCSRLLLSCVKLLGEPAGPVSCPGPTLLYQFA